MSINLERRPDRYRESLLDHLDQKLRSIDWYQFEKLITFLFEAEGHEVIRLGGARPDGGIDLIVISAEGDTMIQCKHWKTWNVGVREVRELLGAKVDSGIDAAIFITLRGYTADAKSLSKKHNVVILNEADVMQMIRETRPDLQSRIHTLLDEKSKRCPKCENQMVLRTAKKGENIGKQFWGCSTYPRCKSVLHVQP